MVRCWLVLCVDCFWLVGLCRIVLGWVDRVVCGWFCWWCIVVLYCLVY